MASQTRNATSPSTVNSLNTSCATHSSTGFTVAVMANFTTGAIPSNACFISYSMRVYMGASDPVEESPDASIRYSVSKNGGSSYCSGHTATVDNGGCTASNDLFVATCSHSQRPSTRAEATGNAIRIKVAWTAGDDLRINFVQHTWNWYVPPTTPAAPTASVGTAQDVDVWVNRPSGTNSPTQWDCQIATNTSFTANLVTHSNISYGTTKTQFVDPEVTEGIVYYTRVRMRNSCGTSNYGTYDTWHCLDTAPVPTGQAISSTQITINEPSRGGNNNDRWQVWGSDVPTFGTFVNISGNIAWTTTTYTEGGLSAGQTRYYKVAWFDLTGSSQGQKSNGYDTETTQNVPTAPGNATYSNRTSSLIVFDWTAAGNGGGTPPSAFVDYHYQWKVDGGGYAHVDTNSQALTAFKDGLVAGTKYWFQVHGVNVIGDGAWNTATSHWTLCATPSTPTIIANAIGSIRIQHSDITGVDKWRVMRSSTSGGTYTQVHLSSAGGGALDWSDTGLGNGAGWYYKLYARNLDGNDSVLGGYTFGLTWDAPTAGTTPTISGQTTTTISFAWGVHGDGGGTPASPLTEYHYHFNTFSPPTSHYDTNSLTLSNVVGDNDEGEGALTAGLQYHFKVHANNAVGTGDDTAEASRYTICTTINSPSVTENPSGTVEVSWSNVVGGSFYRVRRDTHTDFTDSPVTLTSTDTGTPYPDTTASVDIEYFYRIQVKNPDGEWNTEGTSSAGITLISGNTVNGILSSEYTKVNGVNLANINKINGV